MPSPNRLTRKLNEILGPEAGDAMADWMNRADETANEFRQELFGFRQEVRADFAELRQELHAGLARVREHIDEGLASVRKGLADVRANSADVGASLVNVRADVREEMSTVRELADVRVGFADLEKRTAQRHAELLRWLFAYWLLSLVTLIGSMIALARIIAP